MKANPNREANHQEVTFLPDGGASKRNMEKTLSS